MNLTLPDFPHSKANPFLITSEKSLRYNCIAYVYGDYSRPYWPDPNPLKFFWPPHLPRIKHLSSFIDLYSSIGYQVCPNGDLELPIEKIAIFGNSVNDPTHAAKQLTTGAWSSKLGGNHDVSHSIQNISGGIYGHVLTYMCRPRVF